MAPARSHAVVEDFVRRCGELVRLDSAEVSADTAGSSNEVTEDYLIPQLDDEVLSYFSAKTGEYLNTIQTLLQRLEADRIPRRLVDCYRVAHTLKGSAYPVGFEVVGDIAHPIKACMIEVKEGHPGHRSALDYRDPSCSADDARPLLWRERWVGGPLAARGSSYQNVASRAGEWYEPSLSGIPYIATASDASIVRGDAG